MKDMNLPPFYVGQRVVCVETSPLAMVNYSNGESIEYEKEYIVSVAPFEGLGGLHICVVGLETYWQLESFRRTQDTFADEVIENIKEQIEREELILIEQ